MAWAAAGICVSPSAKLLLKCTALNRKLARRASIGRDQLVVVSPPRSLPYREKNGTATPSPATLRRHAVTRSGDQTRQPLHRQWAP